MLCAVILPAISVILLQLLPVPVADEVVAVSLVSREGWAGPRFSPPLAARSGDTTCNGFAADGELASGLDLLSSLVARRRYISSVIESERTSRTLDG